MYVCKTVGTELRIIFSFIPEVYVCIMYVCMILGCIHGRVCMYVRLLVPR